MKFIKLEFIRSAAAIYVLIVHYVLTYINVLPAYIVRFNLFGAEAVTAFFLLSGFVIYYSYIRKQEDFSIYFRKRFRRIYPLFIIAILITLICSYISNELFPLNIKEIIGNIFMLQNQEIFRGNIVFPVKGNPPFWSLANEWWYYMAFIPTLLIGKKYNLSPFYLSVSLSAVATIIYYMHPNFICLIAIYYAVWYAGAEMARVYMNDQNINFKNTRHILFSILLIAIIHVGCIGFITGYNSSMSLMKYPIVIARTPIAACVFVFCSIYFNKNIFTFIVRLIPEKWIQGIANISFGLYIFHYPIINLPDYFDVLIINIVWKVVLIFLLAYIGEKILQPYINKLFPING